ncbi:MAG: type III-B CRISPR module RAMP protein Cmr1 [Desulfobacteraceae bacterium]|nr:type III-B CRISPR module RAMP protein Cmr1 [Desulfobacteraceae bacterium]
MKQIQFDLETVTPMFMSGANQREFELRPPSFKGMMRFWWRAFYWGKNAEQITPQDIEKAEGKIFGTASGKGEKKGQKSGFSIRLTTPDTKGSLEPFPKHNVKAASGERPVNILEYLAYGTHEYQKAERKNVFIRQYLPVNSNFSVILNISDNKIAEEVVMSFYLTAVFGGVGAKSRNGFGGLVIRKIGLEDPGIFHNLNLQFPFPKKDFFDEKIKNPNIPNFTGFSGKMKIFRLKDSPGTWDECLARLGTIYRAAKLSLDEPNTCEKRQYIASPIKSEKRVGGRNRVYDYDQSFLERHSKPYFLKVIQTKNSFDGYIICLPSKYCDGLEKDRNNNRIPADADEKFMEYCNEFNSYLAGEMEKCL